MAERETHPSRKGYVCMDGEEDVVHGTHANLDGALFHFQEAVYGSLPCLPSIGGTRAYLRSFHTRCIVYVTYINSLVLVSRELCKMYTLFAVVPLGVNNRYGLALKLRSVLLLLFWD